MKLVRLVLLIATIHGFGGESATAVEYSQETQEYFFASQLAQFLNVSQDITNQPLWLTNMMQIASVMPLKYLAGFESKFLRFGRSAGFTNSLLEKYTLLPPGVNAPHASDGEMMLIATKALKRENGKLGRVYISKSKDRFGAGWISDEQLQTSLRAARLELSKLPRPPPMPSIGSLYDPDGRLEAQTREMDARAPLWARMQAQIAHACQRLGLGPGWAPWIQLAVVVAFVAMLGLIAGLLWRRVRLTNRRNS